MTSRWVSAAVLEVAAEVSEESAHQLANVLADAQSPAIARGRLGNVASSRQRQLLEAIVNEWEARPAITGAELGAALLSAQAAFARAEAAERVELIWTGPRPAESTLRRTDQALFEVIDRAVHRLLLVTYAAYRVPALEARLAEARERGVVVRLILESSAAEGGHVSVDPFRALRSAVSGADVYQWPAEERLRGPGGEYGALHAKCAVADGRIAFVSSANLTGSAMELNMELGVLIEGVEVAGRIEQHFQGLIDSKVLRVVS